MHISKRKTTNVTLDDGILHQNCTFLWMPLTWQRIPWRKSIMHCYQHGIIWLLTKYPWWQWEGKQLGVLRIVIKKMLSCATLHLEWVWINIALRGHTHIQKKKKVYSFLVRKLEWHFMKWNLTFVNCCAVPLIRDFHILLLLSAWWHIVLLDK